MLEIPLTVVLDRRHQGEYAFHIVRNLIANFLKMQCGDNRQWDETEFERAWLDACPELGAWLPFYTNLRVIKTARGDGFPDGAVSSAREFVAAFAAMLDRKIADGATCRLVRHGRTALNDRTFLGQGRDPSVSGDCEIHPVDGPVDEVYASPLRRALETARALAPDHAVHVDTRLAEIDYGAAEGLSPQSLAERFPHVADAWARGEDVPFPGGECSDDVLRRARSFLASISEGAGRRLAVSHNVVLRIIVADLLSLDLRNAHRIPIAHLEPLDIRCVGGRWMPDWDAAVKARLLDGYAGWVDHA
jgi:probable phosphoglycerate mutase